MKLNHKPNYEKVTLLPLYHQIYNPLNKNYYPEKDLLFTNN